MLFPTVRFAIFFAVVMPASWLLMHRRVGWRVFILGASYVFYGSWDWRFAFLLAGSTLANQLFAKLIHRTEGEGPRKALLFAAVGANLGLLAYFKYFDFFVSSATNILSPVGIDWHAPLRQIVLPVGISFITFQALSYVIDTYRRKVTPVSLLDFAVYLSFFPHLVAGPIVRASEFLPQLRQRANEREVDAGLAFWLIGAGLFKKVVISSYVARTIVDPVFNFPHQHQGFDTLLGIYGYAVQIYADFSGYTDIAIGIALLLGFRFPQNFNSPYTAVSLQDFWRRWHMTLSRWLRDYLYIPLGGNRSGKKRGYVNLMLTMVLGGLWHGAAWTFVAWGSIHGVGLVTERWLDDRRITRLAGAEPPPDPWWHPWVGRLITFNLVCLAWVFFRADSFHLAFEVLGRLFHPGLAGAFNPMLVLVIAGSIASQYVPANVTGGLQAMFSRMKVWQQSFALSGWLLLTNVLGPVGIAPFIYFQF